MTSAVETELHFTSSREGNLRSFLEFSTTTGRPNTITCPREVFKYVGADIKPTPNFDFDRTSDIVEIKIKREAEDTSTTIGGSFKFPVTDMYKFPHEYTYGCFCDKTDKPLSLIKKNDDADDHLSPDLIVFYEDRILVIEFATSRGHLSDNQAKVIVHDKVGKYYMALENRRSQRPIFYYVILTTQDSVHSTLDCVPQPWVDELIMRYRLSIMIQDKAAEELGMIFSGDEDETETMSRLRSMFSAIPLRLSSGKISELDFEVLRSRDYDKEKVLSDLTVLREEAISNFNKENGNLLKDNRESLSSIYKRKVEELNVIEESVKEASKDLRMDMKRVIQMPIISLELASNSSELLSRHLQYPLASIDSNFPMAKCFAEAFSTCMSEPKNWICTDEFEEALALMDDTMRESIEERYKAQRKNYHRVVTSLDLQSRAELAKVGLNTKSFIKANPGYGIDEYRSYRKIPFSYEVVTNDIDHFLEDDSLFDRSDNLLPDRIDSVRELILGSIKKSGAKPESCKFAGDNLYGYLCSHLGRSLNLISDVATELTISLRQHCKKGEWIIKRIRGANLYVLIHPTRSSSHVFFGLAWPKEEMMMKIDSSVVRDFVVEGDWCFTDLISVNKSKLTNLNTAHARGLTLVGMASEHGGIPLCNGDSIYDAIVTEPIKKARRYVMLCLLSMLHDKGFVDEAMSDARYICLEGFKSRPLTPDPASRLRDPSFTFRSRLHVWVVKRLFNAARKILQRGGYSARMISEDESLRVWSNLEDPFTGDSLESPQQLINSFYYNYLHNKDEDPERNTSFKIPKKILEWEDKTPLGMDYLGQKDRASPLDYKTMEFSPSLVRFCCEVAISTQSRVKEEWLNALDKDIFRSLSSLNYENLASLKASASFIDKNMDRIKSRPRVMKALKDLIDEFGVEDISNPCFILDKCLEKQHEIGGLMVDTFPKAQHGGFREILVLSAPCRVIQVVIETIARTICSRFSSEIMTHPQQKLKAPGIHSYRSKVKFNLRRTITVCSSDDAKKWNQGHFVTKFMILLLQFTKPELHKFIVSSLDLWLNKNIMLPNDLLDMIDSLTLEQILNKPFPDDNCNRLALTRKGHMETRWMKSQSSYVTTSSGMLQGILHYTSSLFHTVIQETMPSLFQKVFGDSTGLVVTCMQSSDDSSFMITSPADDKQDFYENYLKSSICFHYKYAIAKAMGIYNSTKSVHSKINIMEFNSEFFDHGNLIRPTNKWVFACLTPPESGSLYERQNHFKNLNSSILEGGGSIMLTSICQMAQALLYYRMMGSSVSPGWTKFANHISNLRDPSLGYFMMDDPLICGLASLKYNLYTNLLTCSKLSAKYKCLLDRSYLEKTKVAGPESLQDNILETLSTGTISSTSLIIYGEKTRWRNLIEGLNLSENWREELNMNPELLYRKSKNMREFELRLALKAHSSGVVESMSHGNSVTRSIASSVYLLTRTVLSLREDFDGSKRKTSILRRLDDDFEMVGLEGLSDKEISFLFPLRQSYDRLTDIRNRSVISFTRDSGLRRKVKSDIVIYDSPVDEMYSLERVMRSVWFDHNTLRVSRRIRDDKFECFREMMPWLKPDVNSSLDASPFKDHIGLSDFMSKIEVKSRVLHLTCAPVGGRRGRTVLESVIYKNQWPGWTMNPIHNESSIKNREIRQEVSQCIYQLSKSPLDSDYKSYYAREILKHYDTAEPPTSLCRPRTAAVLIYLFQRFAKEVEISPTHTKQERMRRQRKWVEQCVRLKSGVFGFYSKPQVKNDLGVYQGRGIWVGRLDECRVEIHLNTRPVKGKTSTLENFIEVLKVDKTEDLTDMLSTLRCWCEEHRCWPGTSSYMVKPDESLLHRLSSQCGYSLMSSWHTPIVVTSSRLSDYSEKFWNYDKLSLELTHSTLRIIGSGVSKEESKVPEWRRVVNDRHLTILSCPMSILDKNLTQIPPTEVPIENTYWKAWLSRTPLIKSHAEQLIATAMNEPSRLGCQENAVREWLMSNFWSTCSRKGISSTRQACTLNELLEDSFSNIEPLQQYPTYLDANLEVNFTSALTMLSQVAQAEVENSLKQDTSDLGLPGDQEFEEMRELFSSTMMVSTPELSAGARYQLQEKYMLDNWVIEMFPPELYGNSLSVFLNKSILQPNLEDFSETLCWLSGISEARLIRTETILFGRAGEEVELDDSMPPLPSLFDTEDSGSSDSHNQPE